MKFTFWILFALFAVLAIVLFSGRGSMLIAGYNTADKNEKSKYDEKKLGWVVGGAMSVLAIMFLVLALSFESVSLSIFYVLLAVVVAVCIVTVVLCNTICRKR